MYNVDFIKAPMTLYPFATKWWLYLQIKPNS